MKTKVKSVALINVLRTYMFQQTDTMSIIRYQEKMFIQKIFYTLEKYKWNISLQKYKIRQYNRQSTKQIFFYIFNISYIKYKYTI